MDSSAEGAGEESAKVSSGASFIAKAEEYKSAGNEFFKKKEYKKAITRFSRVRAYTWQPSGEAQQYAGNRSEAAKYSAEEQAALLRLDQIASGNIAQCHLSLGDNSKCIHYCDLVISKFDDTRHPNPDLLVKALSRSAQASLNAHDLDRAKSYVTRALAIDPKSSGARSVYKSLQVAFKEYNAEQKKAMSAAFARA